MTDISGVRLDRPSFALRTLILLMVAEDPSHGYGLLGRLEGLGYRRDNPGKVYRALAWLDRHGLVAPVWDTDSGTGPARRVYTITDAGQQLLDVHADALRQGGRDSSVDPRATRFVTARLRARDQEAFEITTRSTLRVRARSEAAAVEKATRAVRGLRSPDVDVVALDTVP